MVSYSALSQARFYISHCTWKAAVSRSLFPRLVAHIVKKYYASSTDQEDLISIGTIGLIKAVNSFDNTKGARFATYAARCIENEVLMQFRAGKKSQNDVSIQEPIDSDKDGNSLTLNDGRKKYCNARACLVL